MVALATVKEYFSVYVNRPDELTELIKSSVTLPANAKLVQRGETARQWNFAQGRNYVQYFTFSIINSGKLCIQVSGGWRSYEDGIQNLLDGLTVNLEEYRTSKAAVEALCKKFTDRYQKPSSEGNVKVFYDEGEFMWIWKRPDSLSFCTDSSTGKSYNAATCMSITTILGSGVVPDETRYLNYTERTNINNGHHAEITNIGGAYYFKAGLVPVYRNQVPFDQVYQYVTTNSINQYEHVMVNGQRVYINLKKTANSLLSAPVHGYSTRIESLVPASKLFLRGKVDLYAKRDKNETPFLGWELEACSNISAVGTSKTASAFKEQMPWLIMCKNDGSISPEGFETVSVPATLDFWQESNLSSALDSMRAAPHNMRSWEHVKCGFHVHVSRSALSVLDLQKLERFVHNPENNDFITKVAGRKAGQYQKYSPDLFNNRKKWSSTAAASRTTPSFATYLTEEDVKYFVYSYEEAENAARRASANVTNTSNLHDRLINFGQFINEFVSHEYLDLIINRNSTVSERYPGFAEFSIGDIYPDLRRASPVYLPEITGSYEAEVYDSFYRFLFEEVVCVGRPKFSAIVFKFFPEWNLDTSSIEPTIIERAQAWKAGVRKSRAPYKRGSSQAASQIIKGPVGKGVNSRYDALNTTNANTVEFRMFKGTMNGTTIMRYLEFVDAVVRFVANTTATNEGLHYTTFIRWLSNDSFNIARYEHLVSFISSNGFLDRKDIKRKTLPDVISEDKDSASLVFVPGVGFKETVESKPLGSFTFEDTSSSEPPAMTEEEAAEQYEVNEGAPVDDDEEQCDCDDCRIDRGESLDDEY